MKPKNGTLVRYPDGTEDLSDSVKVDVTAWGTKPGDVVVLTVQANGIHYDLRLSRKQALKIAKDLAYEPE